MKKIKDMVKGNILLPMVIYMKENIKITKQMVMVNLYL
jgi:hypothetical protein